MEELADSLFCGYLTWWNVAPEMTFSYLVSMWPSNSFCTLSPELEATELFPQCFPCEHNFLYATCSILKERYYDLFLKLAWFPKVLIKCLTIQIWQIQSSRTLFSHYSGMPICRLLICASFEFCDMKLDGDKDVDFGDYGFKFMPSMWMHM